VSCFPFTSAAYSAACLLSESVIFPSAVTSRLRSTCHCAAAKTISVSRAAAATLRNCKFISGVVRLPNVPRSYGVSVVSPITIRIALAGTRNSSATVWLRDVRMFCPTSTLPVYTVTLPSSPICSQAPISLGSDGPCAPPAPDSSKACASVKTPTIKTPAPRNLKNSRRSTSK
jgi:hypothetical protein